MSTFGRMLIDTVGDLPFDGEFEDFAASAFALLAAALAKLPEPQRQTFLRDIEAGDLRQAVKQFELCRQSAPDASGWLQ